jgi:hypothetical protein
MKQSWSLIILPTVSFIAFAEQNTVASLLIEPGVFEENGALRER